MRGVEARFCADLNFVRALRDPARHQPSEFWRSGIDPDGPATGVHRERERLAHQLITALHR
ncbi:hypothetical protein ASE48_10595 [Mycobacterium sp. Root265]|nr:hypothetical protein ASE48_10595 [Mycobacterium sp. Root265]